MRFGTKIPFDIFLDSPSLASQRLLAGFGSREALLDTCAELLDGVEIGILSPNTDGETLLSCLTECTQRGLAVSVHGTLSGAAAAEEFLKPYLPWLHAGISPLRHITVHPLPTKEETVRLLSEICERIECDGLPLRINVENQRDREAISPHESCLGVLDCICTVGSPFLGLCFDFGHRLSNLRKNGPDSDPVSEGFWRAVRHTHIHSYYNGRTHFPLSVGETELEENLFSLLAQGYQGLYLLELAPDRYPAEWDAKESLLSSISVLKAAAQLTFEKGAERALYHRQYGEALRRIRMGLEKNENALCVLGPAMYLLKLGDTHIAIDPSLWDMPIAKEDEAALVSLLGECDGVIVTHLHEDHYDPALLDRLSPHIPLFLPDFSPARWQKSQKVLHSTFPGASYSLGEVTLSFYESAHSEGKNQVPEYGFSVYHRGKHYAFPADVRNYDAPLPPLPPADALVAHLWLGRRNALLDTSAYEETFCRFVRRFSPERILLGHLYDFRRVITDMWTAWHTQKLKDRLPKAIPLRLGDVIPL